MNHDRRQFAETEAAPLRVLVTGGAGYIGSHVVHALRASGHQAVVVDDLSTGSADAVPTGIPLEQADVRDTAAVTRVVSEHRVDACVHLAGVKNAGESMTDPDRYLSINVAGTISLLQAFAAGDVRHLVFSSSCAVYGAPARLPVTEESPVAPVSVYGYTKLAAEQTIAAYCATGRLRAVSLRYFNAAGATPDAGLGENWDHTQNLIPLLCKAVLGVIDEVQVFGTDYPTPDGTALRDYIHVADLADAHVAALGYLVGGGQSRAVNLGTGVATSVLQAIASLAAVAGRPVPHRTVGRRTGDPPQIWADASLASSALGWRARHGLDDIVRSAWTWHSRASAAP